jgi:hypothetical protein
MSVLYQYDTIEKKKERKLTYKEKKIYIYTFVVIRLMNFFHFVDLEW